MGAHELDDLEARIDALSAQVDRQDKLIARITVSLYDVVDAVRRAGDLREGDRPHPPETSLRVEPVVDLVSYARGKVQQG
jgi:hypothetical protein